jgi:membrane fusion protein (multidrug efflux system)
MTHFIAKTGLLLVALPTVIACARAEAAPAPQPEAAAISVQSIEVSERSMPKTLLLTGTLQAHEHSDVASDTSGKVVKTFVERGDIVKKGQILAKLDASESAMNAAEAGASAKAAEATAKNARLECERAENLIAQKAISRSEYDRMKASCESSTSSSSAAWARASRASKEVADSMIRAPFGGIVVERFVSVGEFVNPGTKIASVVAKYPMRLELDVPEIAALKLTNGQKLGFSVAPVANESFDATVRFVGPVLDQKSRNLRVEAIVDKNEDRLKPGMFVTSKLIIGKEQALVIPVSTLSGSETNRRVFVIKDGRIQERVVQTGEREKNLVIIEKGLAKGERVVDKPTSDLRDGLAVK